ncbi:MAG: hypothetical protein HKN47_11555 [Pirellulaceae bacterium]|nr:hypothetical protein [Pirellulaceae bacterium]
MNFKTRRIIALIVTAVALAAVWMFAWIEESRLGHSSYFTGFTTLATLFVLILLGMRRRLPMWPLGKMASWTQVHLYTGIFASGVYIMHVPALVGGGHFEFALSMVFWVVAASGFYGVYVSRTVPKRLTAVGHEHRFDRVDWNRSQIAELAQSVLEETGKTPAGQVLENFYNDTLRHFFTQRPSFAYVLIPTGNRRRRLLGNLKDLDRYLENDSRVTAGRFAALVRKRDDLDYQFALQLRLRVWLVVHATFSVVLTAAAVIHAVLALRFTL